MRKILAVSGSRADRGLLDSPLKALREDGAFLVEEQSIWGVSFSAAYEAVKAALIVQKPYALLILGDRYEVLAAATAAHLQRVPIAHIAGGDVTEGSYDDAMRDCISRMASVHFVTSTSAMARLTHMGCRNVHLVGNPGIDHIKRSGWRGSRPISAPYVVVNYQAETIDGTVMWGDVVEAIGGKQAFFVRPNPDRGSQEINDLIDQYIDDHPVCMAVEFLPHDEYLNLVLHCDELIGNSSSMLYEAPELGVKTRMIGKRQKGRTIPMGDGFASERIVKVLKHTNL